MPAPPPQIHIKRKFEDEPVEFLHVHNEISGNRQIKHVFMRKKPRISPPNEVSTNSSISFTGIRNVGNVPSLSTSQPGAGSQAVLTTLSEDPTLLQNPNIALVSASESRQEPRRFYFTRATEPSQNAGKAPGKAPPKVFMEKRPRRVIAKSVDVAEAPKSIHSTEQPIDPALSNILPADSTLVTAQRSPAPLRNTRLPSGRILPWNATATKLASEMEAYTLREIGENISQASTPVIQGSPSLRKPSSKFKPKAPALRYRERHPEAAARELEDQATTDANDDSSYILETYIRMPIEMFQSLEPTKNFGLLVLDSQPDIDEFYNDDSDDESEIYDEEEDENAENHPSTDYPEDEIASDDEYDRNPYRFRNRNASDEEEFDEDDATFSEDDDNEESRKPAWARRTWKMGQPLHDERV